MPEHDDQDEKQKSGLAYTAGLSFFFTVAGFCVLGWLLDRWLQTSPKLIVVGVVLGAIAGFYQFIRLTSKL